MGGGRGGGGHVQQPADVAAAVTAHASASAAHPASKVSFSPTGLAIVTGTDVQAAIAQLDANDAAHAASSTAHPQRAFYAPSGGPSAARFMGGTNGAPTSGTYQANDFLVDFTTGTVWVCSASGTPGSWVDISGSRELQSATKTDAPMTSIGAAVTDITNLASITFDVLAGWIVEVELDLPWCSVNAANLTMTGYITDASNNVKNLAASARSVASGSVGQITVVERISAAGTYTRKGRIVSTAATSGTIQAGDGTTLPICTLKARKVR